MKGWSSVYKEDKEKRANTLEEVKTAIARKLNNTGKRENPNSSGIKLKKASKLKLPKNIKLLV